MPGTNGWHTVFAVDSSVVNRSIAGTTPMTLDESYPSGSKTIRARATCGDWTIAPAGSGRDVRLAIPLTNGTLDVTPAAGAAESFAFAGTVTIEVELTDSTTTTPTPSAAKLTGVARVIGIDYTSTPLQITEDSYLQTAVARHLNADLAAIDAAFATVDLDLKLESAPGFDWLRPTYWTYAVADHLDGSGTVFAVLTMTDDVDGSANAAVVDPAIIPAGTHATFLISDERFLAKILLPGTSRLLLPDSDIDADYAITGAQLQNVVEVNTQPMTLGNKQVVHPKIAPHGFVAEILNDKLHLKILSMAFEFTPDITCNMFLESHHQLRLQPGGIVDLHTTDITQESTTSSGKDALTGEIVGAIVAEIVALAVGAGIGAAIDEGIVTTTKAAMTDAVAASPSTTVTAAANGLDQATTGPATLDAVTDLTAGADEPIAAAGWWARNGRKVWGALIAWIGGNAVFEIPIGGVAWWIEASAKNNTKNLPVIQDYADNVIKAITFPASTGFVPSQAAFDGGMKISGEMN